MQMLNAMQMSSSHLKCGFVFNEVVKQRPCHQCRPVLAVGFSHLNTVSFFLLHELFVVFGNDLYIFLIVIKDVEKHNLASSSGRNVEDKTDSQPANVVNRSNRTPASYQNAPSNHRGSSVRIRCTLIHFKVIILIVYVTRGLHGHRKSCSTIK